MLFRPTKHDIKQLSLLIRKGVKLDYIQEILDVSPTTFDKWRKRDDVAKALTQIPEQHADKFNIYHPDVQESIEEAFEVGLIKYYRFKSEFRLPTGRYKYHYKYLQLNALRIDPERLKIEVDDAITWINGERKKIDIPKCAQILEGIKTLSSLPFDPELARKLAAVSFFTDDEDLSTFDEDYAEKKIKFWKDNNFNDFFLMMPVEEFLNLKGISITSLEEYLVTADQILKDLTAAHPK